MTSSKSAPKDSLVMASILKDMGIIDYEQRVINQMLEYTYRYITNILEDARVFSNHAKKKNLDVEDVKLAIQIQMDKGFASPPPRDILIDISKQRNNIPLPLIKPHCGPRLPPDRYCLSACNYRLKASKRTIKGLPPKLNLQTTAGGVTTKITPAVNLASKSGASLTLVTKSMSSPTVTVVSKSNANAAITIPTTTVKIGNNTAPSPIIKISSGQPTTATLSAAAIGAISTNIIAGNSSSNGSSEPSPNTSTKAPAIRTIVTSVKPAETEATGKRKREDDDDYDAE
ncbi:hypothetical protein CHUAL_000557 [Chamberlinius hualienensis]